MQIMQLIRSMVTVCNYELPGTRGISWLLNGKREAFENSSWSSIIFPDFLY